MASTAQSPQGVVLGQIFQALKNKQPETRQQAADDLRRYVRNHTLRRPVLLIGLCRSQILLLKCQRM
jgi:hypothetical protein